MYSVITENTTRYRYVRRKELKMERMREAIINEFKKLNDDQQNAVLDFVQKLVDENNDKRVCAICGERSSHKDSCYKEMGGEI